MDLGWIDPPLVVSFSIVIAMIITLALPPPPWMR
jgi:hypothetical protein